MLRGLKRMLRCLGESLEGQGLREDVEKIRDGVDGVREDVSV